MSGWYEGETMNDDAEVVLAPALPLLPAQPVISSFQRGWPVAALGVAVLVTVAWMGFLGFGLFKLFEPVFLWSVS